MSNTFLIKKETLVQTADTIRSYLSDLEYVFKPEVSIGFLKTGIENVFYETIDDPRDGQAGVQASHNNTAFAGTGYEYNNEGKLTPVLYSDAITVNSDNQFAIDTYFYIETTELLDGNTYDKWRKIEAIVEGEDESIFYTWTSTQQRYVYTVPIVQSQTIDNNKINPVDFPDKISEVYAAGIATAPTYENANEEVY